MDQGKTGGEGGQVSEPEVEQKRIQTFPSLEYEREALERAEIVREWAMTLDWPDYIGVVSVGSSGMVGIHAADPKGGLPEHFQIAMMKLIPLTEGKLKRVFDSEHKRITWDGNLDVEKIEEPFKKKLEGTRPYIYFEATNSTRCKMIPVKKEITVWELDCSEEARSADEES